MSVRYREDREKWEWSGKVLGKRKRLLFDTEAEAKSQGAPAPQIICVASNAITITSCVQLYFKNVSIGKSRTSCKNERKYFNLMEHFLVGESGLESLAQVQYGHMFALQGWLGRPRIYMGRKMHWGPATVNRAFNSIKDFFVHYVRDGKILASPCQHLQQLSAPDNSRKPMSSEQFRLAYANADEWIKPALLFTHLTAAAPTSVERLKWVDVESERITITRRKGSRGAWRRIPQPIGTELRLLLDHLRAQSPHAGPHASVFRNESGGPLKAAWLSRAGCRAIRAAGLKGVVLYCVRHGFASDMVDANVNVEVIRQLMGHSNIRTTQGYMKPKLETLANALELVRGPKMPPECHQEMAVVACGGK